MGVSRIAFAIIAAAGLCAAGCSTVIKTSPDGVDAADPSRLALVEAANAAAWSPWPAPSGNSLADRLVGGETSETDITREAAIAAYVAGLEKSGDSRKALFADADRHLKSARELKSAVNDASQADHPALADVAIIEGAIANYRENQSIYVAALKEIDADEDDVRQLKDDFDSAIRDLGKAADKLAESAMRRRASQIAARVARVSS